MAKQIWKIENDELVWRVADGESHFDDIEMSALFADHIVYYGVLPNGELSLSHRCYFPTLRTIPNDTHATFCFGIEDSVRPRIVKNGVSVKEYPKEFRFDGALRVVCDTDSGFVTERSVFPASDSRCCVELITVRALEELEITLSVPSGHIHSYGRGTKGVYISRICNDACDGLWLEPNTEITFGIYYSTLLANETPTIPDGRAELKKRLERVNELFDCSLVLKTDNLILDTMTRFAKLRAGESIFETLTGKYHSPGGHSYYAAIWCNDQVEYAGPHFAMTGDKTAIEASLNAYRAYIPFMSESYKRLPSSIISEGLDIWEGAGDRGDAAMYLYGASLFCLYLGNKEIAAELYDAIKWCAEYCERRRSPEGVICSDSDELEGRFPTDGYANLSTSSLCYGGLVFASKLARSLGDDATAVLFESRADSLAAAIEEYFGAKLHGFSTYRYSKGFETLRAWICLPLCMGLTERAEGTLAAMMSPYLWTEEGMLTCERSSENTSDTIWDRSTLYGFKCAFLSGKGDEMLERLLGYCHKRLVCDRVPYAVEAYPEGDKRHLSGESALFVRIITEGLFGIRPEGLDSFSFVASIPKGLGNMSLEKIYIASKCFDIKIDHERWSVFADGQLIKTGETNGERVVIAAQ